MTLDEFVARFPGARRSGSGWSARCPAHDDGNASLSIGTGDDGRVLVHCHAGCEPEAIVKALGLEMRDLMPTTQPKAAPAVVKTTPFEIRDRTGSVEAIHYRHDLSDGKKRFAWERNGQMNLGGLKADDLPLYGAELVAGWEQGSTVVVTEGEKKCDVLRAHEFQAVATVTGSGGTPTAAAFEVLEGFDIVLSPDFDDVGRAHMNRNAETCRSVGIAPRILTGWGEREKGDDLADFFERGGTEEQLDQLLAGAPAWAPAAAASEPPPATGEGKPLVVSFAEFMRETFSGADSLFGEALLVRAGGYLIVGGDGGVGKTIWLANLAIRLASGARDFHGLRLPGRPVAVLFIEAEGSRARFRDWIVKIARNLGYDPATLPIYFRKRDAPLDLEENLRTMIRESGAALVILDPIGAFFEGEENSAKDWRAGVTRPLKLLAEELRVVFAFSDHYTKPNEIRTGRHKIRGSAAKIQDCGAALRLEVGAGGKSSRVLFIDRVRDGEMPDPDRLALTFDLKAGTVELDESGDVAYAIAPSEDVRLSDVAALVGAGHTRTKNLKAALRKKFEISDTQVEALITAARRAGRIKSRTRGQYCLPSEEPLPRVVPFPRPGEAPGDEAQ
jgi:hypothetical protein